MDIKNKNLWQVGAGDTERSYGELCIEFDVMAIGPGDPGPFDEGKYSYLGDIKNSIRRFYREAQRDDTVLLRLGTGQILAVGVIVDDKPTWMEEFGDIDGWDLQHVRRVRWFPDTKKDFPAKTLGGQVRTFANVSVPAVRNWVEQLKISKEACERPLATLPETSAFLNDEELGHQLFLEGLPSEYIDNMTSVLKSIRRVATWYWNKEKRPKGRPSEHETVSYLVMPLLFALGWSHQTAAIEWNGIDIALFERMPPEDVTLTCVVEAKSLDKSVFSPLGQAKNYASGNGRDYCKRLVVTDGIRYTYFKREKADFELHAYLNILRMRKQYPLYKCGGAVEAVIGMAR